MSDSNPPVISLFQPSTGLKAEIASEKISPAKMSGPTEVFTEDDGAGSYVTSVFVNRLGALLSFAQPGSSQAQAPPGNTAAPAATNDSETPAANAWFTIHSPRQHPVSYAEVNAIYLSACRVVEQEFNRTDPVRPRFTLILGAGADGIYYPKSEIQLMKWDKYRFAQAVVLLAVDSLLPLDKRLSLTRLAVLEAGSTVDVQDLKSRHSQPEY